MSYLPTAWKSGQTPADAPQFNNLESAYRSAMSALNADLFSAFVLSGLVATKDTSVATQLDVTAGVAYLKQPAATVASGSGATTSSVSQNDIARVAPAASTFTTSVASATYYLDLNPDGTWSWGTVHSAQANSLSVAQVTTDASGNILTVTDKRSMLAQLLPGDLMGQLQLPTTAGVSVQPPQGGPYGGQIVGGVTGGQPGALVGSPDTAMLFNGTSGQILTPPTGLPTGNNAWSLEGWMNTSNLPASGKTQKLLAFGGWGSNGVRPAVYIDNGAALHAEVWGTSGPGYTIATGAWHHFVATWDGTTLALWVDGASRTSFTPGALSVASTYGLTIGSDVLGNTTGDFFNGLLDECAIYSSALTPAQITNHYSLGKNGPNGATTYAAQILSEPSLLRYYRLDDNASRGRANQAIAEHDPVVAADGTINPVAVASVGGQPAAGGFGVPVIVASVFEAHITSTAQQTLISTTIPAGFYEVDAALYVGNPTSGQKVKLQIVAPGHAVTMGLSPFIGTGATSVGALDGTTTTLTSPFDYSTLPLSFATIGGALSVTYTDPGGTPNDLVSVVVKRLA